MSLKHSSDSEITSMAEKTLERLASLQYGSCNRVLFFTQDPSGLGGQISRRLLGLKLALLLDRKVVFPNITEPPYGQVFKPIHSAIDYPAALGGAVDISTDIQSATELAKLDFWNIWNNQKLRAKIFSYVPDGLRDARNASLYFEGLLLSFCKLTDENQRAVDAAVSRLKIDSNTLGVHIRRGDKKVETPFLPITLINEKIDALCRVGGFNHVFVSSDDDAIFAKVKVPPGVQFSFDEDEQRYNNANHRFLMRNPQLAHQETLTAVKNIGLLGRCGMVIGQSNAHFATLAAAQICYRTAGDYGLLIDGSYSLHHSRSAFIWHTMKTELRSLARRAIPWKTLRRVKHDRPT